MKKSVLDDVHPDHKFWVVDGTTLKNMHELLSALENMAEETFSYHVNEQKNDFHNWVRDVHKDKKLAGILSKVVDKEAAASAIKRRIEEIQGPKREIKNPLQNKIKNSRKTARENKAVDENPFPKPVAKRSVDHRKYQIIVTTIAAVFIISLMGISSQAVEITGAVIGGPQVQEVQFLGLGGVFAVVVLLFAALHAIDRHADNEEV